MRRIFPVLLVTILLGLSVTAQAVNESTTQMGLASSPVFLARVQYLLVQTARTVKAEPLATPCHAARAGYATNVINNPAGIAPSAAVMLVGGVNLIGTVTGTGATADSSASDAAIFSQINTYWSWLAGCDTGA